VVSDRSAIRLATDNVIFRARRLGQVLDVGYARMKTKKHAGMKLAPAKVKRAQASR
jgi:hypothetical protein